MRSSSDCTLDSSETRLPQPTTCHSSGRQPAARSGRTNTCAAASRVPTQSLSRTASATD